MPAKAGILSVWVTIGQKPRRRKPRAQSTTIRNTRLITMSAKVAKKDFM